MLGSFDLSLLLIPAQEASLPQWPQMVSCAVHGCCDHQGVILLIVGLALRQGTLVLLLLP